MKRVHIIYDIYDSEKKTVAEVDSVLDYLKSEFKEFPKNAKVFHKAWHDDNDITEELQKNENYADSLDGDIIIVIYPAWIQFIYYAIVAITAALSIYTFLTMPKPQAGTTGSSNNELSARVNRARIGGRIPDIYGTIRSIPDLVAPPLRYFQNNVEIEECLMCIGRGYYQIADVKDGSTSIEQIDGISISVYDPNQSLTTANPIYRYGDVLSGEPLIGTQSRSINGQTLLNASSARVVSDAITFSYPNIINVATGEFSNGQSIAIEGARFGVANISLSGTVDISIDYVITVASSLDIYNPQNFKKVNISSLLATDPIGGLLDLAGIYDVLDITKSGSIDAWVYEVTLINPDNVNQNFLKISEDLAASISSTLTNNIDSINLDGTYTININSGSKITLSAPDNQNPDWLKLQNWGSTSGNIIGLYGTQDNWLGWYETDIEVDQIYVNFFAPQGLYHIGEKGYKEVIGVQLEIEYQAIDLNNNPVGTVFYKTQALFGNIRKISSSVGLTLTGELAASSRMRYRLRRTTVHTSKGTVVDEVQAKSVYVVSKLNKIQYEDVTLVRSVTITNDITAGIKEREMNMLVTRRLPLNGTGALIATNSAAQALINIALDQKNGRMGLSEIDVAQILTEEQSVIDYFGSSKAAEFSYTFDDNNLSFEEMAGMIASTIFCEAYRYGSKLRLRFEKPQDNSVLLFNHTNKAPNSEKRTKSFGIDNNYDGVEVEYTSPSDDTRITFVATDSPNPINTLKIKTSGIRSDEQAKTRAWREWNKLKYRNMSVEFEAWEESELLARMDRILVADNTTIETIDGEVEAVDGLKLYLSQPIPQSGDYNIYLQLPNATVDIVPCTYLDEYSVQLTRMPLVNLAIGRATYQLILSSSPAPKPFLMTELRPQSKMTNILTCINYDSRYYQNDLDFF